MLQDTLPIESFAPLLRRCPGFLHQANTVFGAMLLVSIGTCILAPIILQGLFQRWPQQE